MGLNVNVPKENVYTVKAGDTLGKIAKANNTTVEKIAKDNDIKNLNVINVGQKLKIGQSAEPKLGLYVEQTNQKDKKSSPKVQSPINDSSAQIKDDTKEAWVQKYKRDINRVVYSDSNGNVHFLGSIEFEIKGIEVKYCKNEQDKAKYLNADGSFNAEGFKQLSLKDQKRYVELQEARNHLIDSCKKEYAFIEQNSNEKAPSTWKEPEYDGSFWHKIGRFFV